MIEIEDTGFNSTLASWNACDNANNDVANDGFDQADKWADIYTAPIIERLSQYITGFNLTSSYITGMQETCAYEVRADNEAHSYAVLSNFVRVDCRPWLL